MAKHDSARSQNQINNQGATMQDSQNALMNQLQGQNQGFTNNYNVGAGLNVGDYNNNQNNYNQMFNGLASGQFGVGTNMTLPSAAPQGGMPSYTPGDKASVDAFLSYAKNIPGINPSVINDPGYWEGKMMADTSAGGLGPDANYVMQKMMTPEGAGSSGGGLNGALSSAQSGFQNFADTGGFSPQDIQDMRARSQSAMRSTYQNAQNNLNRAKASQQFSPNYAAATAKMSRDLGYGLSDAATNSNAAIAQMIQSGKLSGLQGLTGVAGLNQQGQGMNMNAMLGALGGSSSLYGATPGLANTFGNQMLNSSGQMLGGLQNQTNIGTGLMNAQNYKGANVKGDFQQGIDAASSVIKPVAGAVGAFVNPLGSAAGSGGGGY